MKSPFQVLELGSNPYRITEPVFGVGGWNSGSGRSCQEGPEQRNALMSAIFQAAVQLCVLKRVYTVRRRETGWEVPWLSGEFIGRTPSRVVAVRMDRRSQVQEPQGVKPLYGTQDIWRGK